VNGTSLKERASGRGKRNKDLNAIRRRVTIRNLEIDETALARTYVPGKCIADRV
jgi:hypothetical protein